RSLHMADRSARNWSGRAVPLLRRIVLLLLLFGAVERRVAERTPVLVPAVVDHDEHDRLDEVTEHDRAPAHGGAIQPPAAGRGAMDDLAAQEVNALEKAKQHAIELVRGIPVLGELGVTCRPREARL